MTTTTGSGQFGSTLLHDEDTANNKDSKSNTGYPLWRSCRLVYTICAFFCTVNLILMRFNISFAMVCMVSHPLPNETHVNVSTGNITTVPDGCVPLVIDEQTIREDRGEFTWSKELQGRILSGFFYGYTISQGFGGWFSDKFGGKMFFVLGNLLQSICTLFAPLAARWDPEALFVLRIIQGIVCGLCLPALYQLFARWAAPTERTRLMSIAYTGFPLANVIIFPLASELCQLEIDGGWPMIFYITGLFGLICSLSYIVFVHDNPNVHPTISPGEKKYLNSVISQKNDKEPVVIPWVAITKSKACLAYNVAHFCQTWGFITLAVNLPTLMKELLYFDISSNGWLSSLPYLAALVMRICIAEFFWPIQKYTGLSLTNLRKINHLIGTIIPAIAALSITFLDCSSKYTAVGLIVVIAMFSDLGFTGSYLLSYLDLAPTYAGLLTGLSNMIGSIPGIISPTITGYITKHSTKEEWATVLYIMAALYLFGGIFYAIAGSSELQPWAVQKRTEDKEKQDTLL